MCRDIIQLLRLPGTEWNCGVADLCVVDRDFLTYTITVGVLLASLLFIRTIAENGQIIEIGASGRFAKCMVIA